MLLDIIQETVTDVENAIIELGLMPDIIQTLIDDLHLDYTNAGSEQIIDIGRSYNKIHSVLTLSQLVILNTEKELNSILSGSLAAAHKAANMAAEPESITKG